MLTIAERPTQEVCIKKECRFYLFVRWKKGARSFGPDTSTYNGNKHVPDGDVGKQLINLIKIFSKDQHKMAVALLYDNTVPKYDAHRDIIKMANGVIETNRIQDFTPTMYDFKLPDYLR